MNLMYVMIHVEMFINEINSCIYAPMLVIEVPTAPKIASEPLLTSSTTIHTHVIGILYQYTISYICILLLCNQRHVTLSLILLGGLSHIT